MATKSKYAEKPWMVHVVDGLPAVREAILAKDPDAELPEILTEHDAACYEWEVNVFMSTIAIVLANVRE